MSTTEDTGDKNFLEKNSEDLERPKKIFDFTYHKLHHMIDHMGRWSPGDAEILVLNNILELYIDGEIEIHWIDGYPLPYPIGDNLHQNAVFENPDDILGEYEDLYEMGLLDEFGEEPE